MSDIDGIFAPQGALAKAREGFERRDGQRRMAEAVAAAFALGRHLVVEAGTGTGKTLAYLVPVLRCEGPVVLSTGTKALQEQVVVRELPVALAATGVPREVVVLKGRENYLCLKRLAEMEQEPRLDTRAEAPLWETIRSWARTTGTGDRNEIPGLPDASPLWSRLDARTDVCTGPKCADYERCFAIDARRRAQRADVVVVNHHLLCADLALRRARRGQILPDAPFAVLDEAHLVEETAVAHFGAKLTARMVTDLAADAKREMERLALDPRPALELERQARAFFRALRPVREGRIVFDRTRFLARHEALADILAGALDACERELSGPGERADERELLVARCVGQRAEIGDLLDVPPHGSIVTVEAQGKDGALLAMWPVDATEILAETLGRFRAVVACSATLSVAGSLDRAARRLGVQGAKTLIVPSPFRHHEQAALYVPRVFPEPGSPDFAGRALDAIEELLSISSGRGLVLFASHRALRAAAERLTSTLPWPVLVQGAAPREQLVERFRGDVHSVLLGTASFRQGIDVPGEALSIVIVDKLPFAVPDDPIVAARAELIRSRGGSPFDEDSLPEAILGLKQGLGRLIRTRADRGMLALLDVRVRTKGYGRTVLASLPPWPLLDDVEQAREWFRKRVR